ncbi:hypothetical protein BX600DRAFT_82609 [Xylariales sp. PMI_506]|nr:hypothetical protein BX600DRAFT_82609 [Xylariales sp. PMI_506]
MMNTAFHSEAHQLLHAPREACTDANLWNHWHELPPTPPGEETGRKFDVSPSTCETAPAYKGRKIVAVIGVGYVGAHLVEAFGSKFSVIAFDVNAKRLEQLRDDFSQYLDVQGTTDPRRLQEATHFLISVPTMLQPDRSIDLTYLRSAIKTVSEQARPGSTVVIESSVAVGMTRDLLEPLMRSKGIKAGMSPERVDPGRTDRTAASIPKIISGLDDITLGSLESIREIYAEAFDHIVTVSKPEVAEMVKLYENCQRMVNIAYANEMADACGPHGIDPYEVCRAAGTKPFGYIPFTPGLGVGGPCIPCNPYYLFTNNDMPILQHATERMWQRPAAVAGRIMKTLSRTRERPRVLVVGVGFKKGQSLTTHAPGVSLINALQSLGAEVAFVDPLVAQETLPFARRFDHSSRWTKEDLEASFDYAVIAVRQDGLDYELLEGTAVPVECFSP